MEIDPRIRLSMILMKPSRHMLARPSLPAMRSGWYR
jgi:hypothetical protein